jgi:hypothetical protein
MSGKMDALDILANAVTHLEQLDSSAKYHNLNDSAKPVSEHRVSCHRCGNIRRKRICCPNQQCPHIFCGRYVLPLVDIQKVCLLILLLFVGAVISCVQSMATLYSLTAALW